MREKTCYVCHGDRAVSSPNRGCQMADVWCPRCNLTAYLKEVGQETSKEQILIFNSEKALDHLKEDLDFITFNGVYFNEIVGELGSFQSYKGYARMFKFQANAILKRAKKKCLELTAQNPYIILE